MTLKGFTSLGESTISNDVIENLISYFDWHMLQQGNSIEIGLAETGVYGADDSRLRMVDDPRYTDGQIWATSRPNIVWESGAPSGVYVNSTFYSTPGSGAYSHFIDHIHGVVHFDTAISTSAVVKMPHTYKYVTVTRANGLPWFKEIQQNAESSTDDFVNSSGAFQAMPENRQALPLIGFELAGKRMKPYQLGGGQTVCTDYYAHIVTEDIYTRDMLIDTLVYQADQSFQMYDINEVAASGHFPLDYRGVPASGAKTFPELVSAHPGRVLYVEDAKLDSTYPLGNLYVASVKLTTEVIHFGV
jgi:hypothetical protein